MLKVRWYNKQLPTHPSGTLTGFYEDKPCISLVLSAVTASHTPVLPERNTPQESQSGLNSRLSRRTCHKL